MKSDRSSALTALLCAGFLLISAAAFSPVLDAGFIVIDDYHYVLENPPILRGVTIPGIVWSFSSFHSGNWHPLTWISHMVDVELFGLRPAGHHLTNLLLHGTNVLLLFALLRVLTGAVFRSALVAALFAVHPLHVQSVAWVSERKDVLAGLFWLLTCLAYCRYVRKPRAGAYALVLFLFAFGLAAKPMLVTLPLCLLLLDFWPLGRLPGNIFSRTARSLATEKAPLLFLSAASSLVTFFAQQSASSVVAFERLPLAFRLSNAALSYLSYIFKTIWPQALAVYYPYPAAAGQGRLGSAAWLVVAGLTVAAFTSRRTRPQFLTGWLWFLGALLPVIGLIQVGAQAMADRYTYLPLIGLFVAVVWTAQAAAAPLLKRHAGTVIATGLLVVAMLAALTARSRSETSYWRDSLTLLDRAVEVTGENFAVLSFKGLALARIKRFDEAVVLLRKALDLSKALDLNRETSLAQYNLASIFAMMGRTSEAAALYREILQGNPRDDGALVALGAILLGKSEATAAALLFEEALRIAPDNHVAHYDLSLALELQGRVDEALSRQFQALRVMPGDPKYQLRVGYLLARQDRFDEAFAAFQRTLALDSRNSAALFNMAQIRDREGRTHEAIELYNRVLALDPTSAETHNNIGATLAEVGERDEALVHFREALRLQPDHPEARANLDRAERPGVGGGAP